MNAEEEFEMWFKTVPTEYTDVINEDVAKAAYLAGRAAQKERDAGIAEGKEFGNCSAVEGRIRFIIAAAIRAQE